MSKLPKLMRAFSKWLSDPQTKPLLPISVRKMTGSVEFTIHTKRASLWGWASEFELTVPALIDGESWDLLLSLDVNPTALPEGGFACSLCDGDKRERFDTVEALWQDHLFNPLGEWLKCSLLNAQILVFHQTDNKGATWADLHVDNKDIGHPTHMILL